MNYYTVEECCEILDSKRKPVTASKRIKGIYPYYGANGIQDYVNNFIFDDELVLVAEDGGNFGSKTKPIAYKVSGKCWINNHAHVLKPKEFINIDYLLYALMFYDTSSLITGSTRMKLNKSQLSLMKIPSIPLKEQIKVSTQLNSLTKCIILKKENLKYLDELIKSRFNEMFGNKILEQSCKFEDICESVIGLTYKPSNVSSTGTIVLRSGNIQNNELQLEQDVVKVENIRIPEHKIIKKNDILMCSRNGSTRLVGKSCLVKEVDENMTFGAFMTVIRTKYPYIVQSFMNSEYFRSQLTGTGTSSVNQITNKMLNSYDIFKPTDTDEQTFADFVKLIDKSKLIIEKQIKELQELFDSKMDQYFG